jgi:hypothetical protein
MYKSVDSFGDKYSTIPHLWKIIFSLLWAEKNISISVENHAPTDRAIKAKGRRQKQKIVCETFGMTELRMLFGSNDRLSRMITPHRRAGIHYAVRA